MIDLHTHILPGMDDGAKDVDMSLAMLHREREQRVRGVALTPHFYREDERPEHFFARRQKAWDRLRQGMDRAGGSFPELILGAEVAWVPGMNRWDGLERFALGESGYMLLELPDAPWKSTMIDQIYDMMERGGIVPVLAHMERYFRTQKPEYIRELLGTGVPVQISAEAMLHLLQRRAVLKRIKEAANCMLISDCHGLTHRAPNLGQGFAQARKSLPMEQVSDMRRCSRTIFEQAVGKERLYAEK